MLLRLLFQQEVTKETIFRSRFQSQDRNTYSLEHLQETLLVSKSSIKWSFLFRMFAQKELLRLLALVLTRSLWEEVMELSLYSMLMESFAKNC